MEAWHDFYVMAGGASAALLGLLFVSLTIQIRAITAKAHPELRATAELILGNFVITLVISFVALVPVQTKLSLGIDLAIVGLYGAARTVFQVLYVRRHGVGLGPQFRLLTVSTAAVAYISEVLVGALEPTVEALGLSRLFVGLILVPIIGNAAEHASAVVMAMRDKMEIAVEIAIGSSTQIAVFVAPVLVFVSLLVGHPMDFVFSPPEIAAVGVSVAIVSFIALDGRSNWFEGAQLLSTYSILAVSFFFL
jgi:Ca2+/Na+ antiporter